MAKNLKLHIKNVQIAGAINLNGLKAKLSKKKGSEEEVLTGGSVESTSASANIEPANIETANIESAKPPKKTSTAKSKKIEEQPVETVPVKEIKAKESPVKTVEEKKSPLPVVEKPVEIKKEEVVVSKQPQPAAPVTVVEEKVSASPKSPELKSPPKSSSSWRDVPPQRTHSQSTGFQPREDRPTGFQPREDRPTGFQPRRDDNRPSGFQPREDRPSGFQPRRDDNRPSGFQPREDRPTGFQPRRDDSRPSGFQPREDRPSGFQPRRDDNRPSGFQPRRDDNRPSGFQPREDRPSGFQPRRDDGRPSGFQPRRDDGRPSGFQPRRDDGRPSGFQPRREDGSGYPPRREEGFQPRRDDGRPPRPYGTSPRPPVDARRMAPFAKSPPQVPSGKSELMGDRRISDRKTFTSDTDSDSSLRRSKVKPKETRDTKPAKKGEIKDVDVRLRHGFKAADDEDQVWRKRRPTKQFRFVQEQEVIRPTKITVRLPISVKDLAAEMKLKASELISKFFLQGIIVTLNDLLDDDTAVSLLGDAFGCEISIDTKEEERIRITDKTIREEIAANEADLCKPRPPVIAFMGHVDHGKTSLVDYIRKSNVASHEVGAITQHIGSFTCHTSHGDITILDTPGHEAFSQMRGRGAEITDIVVLVIAGDEGMKEQTYEALAQATSSNATVVVAITKSDKPNFNVENVYRQLSEKSLLPEVWGGQTITINCSAVTGEGVQELLEMLALQADILELKANPSFRARGTVIESEVYKGLGPVATVLVQNGTLNIGDCLVFGYHWARVKAMRDDKGKEILKAGPSIPALINGLSGLPESGEEFIVVKNEKEAKDISQVRQEGRRQTSFQMKKRLSVEGMLEKAADVVVKKVLNLILRADVQGSVEALKNSIEKIQSKKVEVNIISAGVGEISESDVQLALASKAIVIGFHTSVESHVEPEIKELGVQVRLHDIIYHAVDDIKVLMRNLLEKIPQDSEKGKAEVKAVFKSSQLGLIAGCQVTEGVVARNSQVRLLRDGKVIWKGGIASLKRNKEDVREVQKGIECGILLQNFTDVQQGDVIEAFEVIYLTQDL